MWYDQLKLQKSILSALLHHKDKNPPQFKQANMQLGYTLPAPRSEHHAHGIYSKGQTRNVETGQCSAPGWGTKSVLKSDICWLFFWVKIRGHQQLESASNIFRRLNNGFRSYFSAPNLPANFLCFHNHLSFPSLLIAACEWPPGTKGKTDFPLTGGLEQQKHSQWSKEDAAPTSLRGCRQQCLQINIEFRESGI